MLSEAFKAVEKWAGAYGQSTLGAIMFALQSTGARMGYAWSLGSNPICRYDNPIELHITVLPRRELALTVNVSVSTF